MKITFASLPRLREERPTAAAQKQHAAIAATVKGTLLPVVHTRERGEGSIDP